MDSTLRRRMVRDLSDRLDVIQAGFETDEVLRTRSLLLSWKSWSCRVLRLLYGPAEALRFEGALAGEIESTPSAAAWVQHAKRCLERVEDSGTIGFFSGAARPTRVLVTARARA